MRTLRCLQLLLTSHPRRARAAGLLLRLPTSQPEQATPTAWSAAAGHADGQEATRAEVGPEATRGACGGLQGPMGTLCRLLEGGLTALKALPCRPYRPRGR